MTVATVEATHSSGTRRVTDAVRIQMVAWLNLLAWPAGLLAMVFLLNLAVFAVVRSEEPSGSQGTGGLIALYAVVGVSHLQSMTQVFPFALGLSITRRAFYLATVVVAVVQAALFGLLLTLLSLVESATGGWGVRMQFFRFEFLDQGDVLAQWLVYAVPFLAVSAVFMAAGVVFKRWGQAGVYTMSIGAAVLVTGAVLVLTWLQLWQAVGSFFATTSTLALFAGYPLLIALVLGGARFLVIRRATP